MNKLCELIDIRIGKYINFSNCELYTYYTCWDGKSTKIKGKCFHSVRENISTSIENLLDFLKEEIDNDIDNFIFSKLPNKSLESAWKLL